ncbi:hypothetical protein HDG32_005715 [Paraburkholderia sp. CI2]|nr:hypothetical protein [Paraburkholderia sp. CI2]
MTNGHSPKSGASKVHRDTWARQRAAFFASGKRQDDRSTQ